MSGCDSANDTGNRWLMSLTVLLMMTSVSMATGKGSERSGIERRVAALVEQDNNIRINGQRGTVAQLDDDVIVSDTGETTRSSHGVQPTAWHRDDIVEHAASGKNGPTSSKYGGGRLTLSNRGKTYGPRRFHRRPTTTQEPVALTCAKFHCDVHRCCEGHCISVFGTQMCVLLASYLGK